jgi:PIN domain nuclease of toxin-antitoxin system
LNFLVDTHLLLWAAGEPSKLSKSAQKVLSDASSILWFSAASIWEVAIKRGLGRGDFQIEPQALRRGLIENGWLEAAVSGEHAVATLSLPPIHKDPFDRMLLAQVQVEGYTLLTSDKIVATYPGLVRRV